MKLEFIGCCFRIELEFFRRTSLDLRRHPFVRGENRFALRRELLKQTIATMKTNPAFVELEAEVSP